MKTIALAGATGNLGGLIAAALIQQGAAVRAIVRPGTKPERLQKLRDLGVEIREGEMSSVENIAGIVRGSNCVVSALQGVRDTIVDGQTVLLDAAVAAHVPRFIPSDFAVNYNHLEPGQNRNFDLRRDFAATLDKAPIRATSIWNGAFAALLGWDLPLLDTQTHTVAYWGDPDFRAAYTTMENTAAFTAAAALDDEAPRDLTIASFRVTAAELAAAASEVTGVHFETVDKGSLQALAAHNRVERAAHPEGENEVIPDWQMSQNNYSLFKVAAPTLDNDRYPQVKWTGLREALQMLSG